MFNILTATEIKINLKNSKIQYRALELQIITLNQFLDTVLGANSLYFRRI